MPRFKLTLAYDGTAYQGWQRQKTGKSIQGTLESAIFDLFNQKVDVVGSGRTDAGVHALGQVAHVDLARSLSPKALMAALNSRLPPDIRIRHVAPVPGSFHARYSAVKRTYLYLVRHGIEASPFTRAYVHQFPLHLDLEPINRAASFLVGQHDFSAFRATGGGRTNPVRRIFVSRVFPASDHLICYLVTADAFLRKMVRGIVGTLLEIGIGKSPPSLMQELLATRDRSLMPPLAPPQGLYLAAVLYPPSTQVESQNG